MLMALGANLEMLLPCVARLLEAVRHGGLTLAFKTQPCDGNGSKGCSVVDRATCWRYHTEEERLPRLVPKQHMCSFIKVGIV